MQKIAFGQSNISDMLTRMNPGGWQAQTVQAGPWTLGTLTRPDPPAFRARWTGIVQLGADVAVIAGLPLLHCQWPDSGAALVAALRDADGIYAAAVWCAASRTLHIVTDFLGCQSLHRSGTDYASETKAFQSGPCARGWGALIAYGHCVGDDTLLAGVQRMGAAHHITLDTNGSSQQSVHWSLPARESLQSVTELCATFRAGLQAYADCLPPAAEQLLLSGGFDSRLIAAALPENRDRTATILAHEDEDGDADGWIAHQVAQHLGSRTVQHVRPCADYFSSPDYLDHLWAVDGAYPTHGLFIAQVLPHICADAVWEGQLPNVSIRAIHPAGGFAAYDAAKRADADHPRWQAAQRLFTPAAYDSLRHSEAAATQDSRADFADDDIGVGHWVTLNRMRRRAGLNIYQAYAQRAEPLAAGAARAFWSQVQSHPAAVRRDGRLAMQMLRHLDPALARLPLSTGGRLHGELPLRLRARVAAGRWLGQHPRAAARLGWPRALTPSRFLDHPALYEAQDDWISQTALDRLRGTADLAAKTLLWHLRSWQWLHGGQWQGHRKELTD